jgi:hypothetical protein
MAVTTTPSDILAAALGTSLKNRPGVLATAATELLQKVIRALRGLYAVAARVNPTFFAESASVTFASTGWARPENAESVYRLERVAGTTGGSGSAGDEVVVVPFDDRAAELGRGAVYAFGKVYRSAGNAKDPTGGDLAFWYARRPTSPATVNATLDPQWTEQFNELLILEVALYLAGKEPNMRGAELALLSADRLSWLNLFIEFLQHETANTRHRYGHQAVVNVNSLLPLLAPGG